MMVRQLTVLVGALTIASCALYAGTGRDQFGLAPQQIVKYTKPIGNNPLNSAQ